jgi:GNAT superfamily N-acetyltransferase
MFPAELKFETDEAPGAELRAALADAINEFHARSVPDDGRRFAMVLRDAAGGVAAGVIGGIGWRYLFVSALFVAEAWRGKGLGAALLARAEARAVAAGCHSVWLDTFQAREFYVGQGYEVFAELPDYPGAQSRWFLRKALGAGGQ